MDVRDGRVILSLDKTRTRALTTANVDHGLIKAPLPAPGGTPTGSNLPQQSASQALEVAQLRFPD